MGNLTQKTKVKPFNGLTPIASNCLPNPTCQRYHTLMKKMNYHIFIVLTFLFAACNQSDKKNSTVISQLSDTSVQSDTAHNLTISYQDKLSKIDSFLLKPFDLYNFKKKKGSSNSGGADKQNYFFKPDFKGLYYKFFIFEPLKGYIGKSKDNIVKMENGLSIITFKPLGKYQYEYLDPEEILIEVKALYNDFDLPELAFIGLDTIEIKKEIGEKYFIKNNCMVYTFSDRALILGLQKNKIIWLKYVHLNAPITADFKLDKLLDENINVW